MDIKDIQQELAKLGFDPGAIDGIWGRRTIAAVRAFQAARGLTVDGIAGPETMRALFPVAAIAGAASGAPLVWFKEALSLVGTKEVPGTESNQRIIDWAKDFNIDYNNDDIPWCGLFVAHCIGSTLPDEALPGIPLLARSWLKFGQPCDPVRGALLVFWREKKDGPSGHVGFYRSEDPQFYHVLGGNQSNAVNITSIAKERLLGARWPRTAASVTGETMLIAGAVGDISINEA